MPFQLTKAVGRTMLTNAAQAAAGAAGVLNGCLVGLIAADFGQTDDLVLADLTEAAFTGYARSAAVVWGAAFQSGDVNLPYMQGDSKVFGPCTALPETIFGMMLVNGAGNTLLATERFDEGGVPVIVTGQLTCLPQISNSTLRTLAEPNPITA